MSDAAIVHYGAQIRQSASAIYCQNGERTGAKCARASLRETAEVIAVIEGRDKAVAFVDELANAVLAELPLAEMKTFIAPAPPLTLSVEAASVPARAAKPHWRARLKAYASDSYMRGLRDGLLAAIVLSALAEVLH